MIGRRATVIAAALALDAALGELPNRWHPIAWFGRAAAHIEQALLGRDRRREDACRGALFATLLVGGTGLAGLALGRWCGRQGVVGAAVEAFALKQLLAARALLEHGLAVREALVRGDLPSARTAAGRMVSRDVLELPEGLVASAAVESLAENASDSVVAPACWYLVAGLPGAAVYRAANTLDAMVGYRSRGRFGMVPARLDDVLNVVPARLTAMLFAMARPRAAMRWSAVLREAGRVASPNAGWPMAAMAHALGVRLEKREHHVFNAGSREPGPRDIEAAANVVVGAIGLGLALLLTATAGRRVR